MKTLTVSRESKRAESSARVSLQLLQRKSIEGERTVAASPRAGEVLRSSGQPLDVATRSFIEPRFAHDFSRARVHTDKRAVDLSQAIEAAEAGTIGAGEPLPFLPTIQESFGRHDVRDVSTHTDAAARRAAAQFGVPGFTIGRHIAFAGRPSLHVAAHEAAHAVQQRSSLSPRGGDHERHANRVADQVVRGESSEFLLNAYSAKPLSAGSAPTAVQGYEAGEHARLGETQAELKKTLSAPTAYTVVKGETLKVIATRFGLAVDELKEANKTKLRKWPANDGSGNLVEGFNAGETITIPAKLNELAETATKDPSAKFTVNGVVLDYGVGIAMGDLFENPAEMAKASPEELKELAALINRERSGGKAVSTDEWQKATKGRYLKLAEKNAAHFAPTNAARVATTTAGAASPNHKATWETHHKSALDASQAGNKDQALSTNAFGDHFLTDAFSAGHLINKADVMESFKSQLKLDAKGKDFTPASQAFFDDVAKTVFVGNVKTEFSKFEAADAYALGWHPNVNSDSRFSTLLQGIHKEKPDLLANAVAKGVHDGLNTLPGGLPVVNAKGGKWNLSGDGTLNAQTTAIAREAVAQSQSNIVSVFKTTTKVDYPVLYKKVWDYTPEPDPDGMKQLSAVVSKGSSTTSPELKKSIVDLIKSNYLLLIAELVKLKKLRKA